MNIAVVTAHPDDAEYMMGGTIIKYINNAHKVSIIVCTNGNIGHPTLSKEEISEIRLKEAQEGAKVMGAEIMNLGYDDEFMPDTKESRLKVVDALRKVKAEVVFTHHPSDYTNADHRVVSNIVIDMSYLQMVKNIETKYKETESYAALYYMDFTGGFGFDPTDYVDISNLFDKKKEALEKHTSQTAWMSKMGVCNNFAYTMQIQAAFRGIQYQCLYAEGFIFFNRFGRVVKKNLLP
ncbi:MAG: PIG-L family deacetylase [Actinobacteria bacterium]|nr:PIG-L family deacetylase [Actinomycetota bacterium]